LLGILLWSIFLRLLLLGSLLRLLRRRVFLGSLARLLLLAAFLGLALPSWEFHLSENLLELGLGNAQLEPAHQIRERLEVLFVKNVLHAIHQSTAHRNVCQCDAVSDHVGVVKQVLVQHTH